MNGKVLIAGLGRIGLRHLQGVLKSKNKLAIEVFDPFEEALKCGLSEFEKTVCHHSIKSHSKIENISGNFDVVIVTTCSDVRKEVIKSLLNRISCKNLILEKVPFQKVSDYTDIQSLLIEKKVNAYINCPRPMFSDYQSLKKSILPNEKIISYAVHGGPWGLGCNSLHFLDLFHYLFNLKNLEVDISLLNPKLFHSKRANFYEVFGELNLKYSNGVRGSLVSLEEGPVETIHIFTNLRNIVIDEGYQKIYTMGKEGVDFRPQYQSVLSGVLIDSLLEDRKIELVNYADSLIYTLPFMQGMETYFSKHFPKLNLSPIT